MLFQACHLASSLRGPAANAAAPLLLGNVSGHQVRACKLQDEAMRQYKERMAHFAAQNGTAAIKRQKLESGWQEASVDGGWREVVVSPAAPKPEPEVKQVLSITSQPSFLLEGCITHR